MINKTLRIAVPPILVVLVILAACSKTPEEKVAKLRSNYTARLVGILVDAVPETVETVAEGVMDGEDGEVLDPGAEASEAVSEMPAENGGDDAVEEPMAPLRQNVKLDILIQHDSPEKLPGITLDIEMVDADQNPKNSWKLWVDTSTLPKATGSQFTHLLEDVDYVEGDGFNVEVRSFVPPEERDQYREFVEAGG